MMNYTATSHEAEPLMMVCKLPRHSYLHMVYDHFYKAQEYHSFRYTKLQNLLDCFRDTASGRRE